MNITKIIINSLCGIMISVSAMDKGSQPLDVTILPLESYTFSSYIPKLPSLGEISQCVVSNWSSVTGTVMNNVSDAAAFKKLGWPPHDPIARQALERSTSIYARINQSIAQKKLLYEGSEKDYDFVDRRYEYCQRVLRVLESHPEGAQLALHCITHHKQVLRPFDVIRLSLFIQLNEEKSKQTAQDLALVIAEGYDAEKY